MEKDQAQSIRNELLAMSEADQAMRNNNLTTGEWNSTIDTKNTERLKQIVAGIGWPGISMFGVESAAAAWLLVQHADAEPDFQEHCLDLMKRLATGEVSLRNLAYLEDRVRVNTGRSQLYGTQFYRAGDVFGPRPIEDPEHLDERRAAAGMEPFVEYEKVIRAVDQRHQVAIGKADSH